MAARHTDSIFIDLIGAEIFAVHFGLTPQRLYMWRKRGIPGEYRPSVAQLAMINGKSVPVDFLKPRERAKPVADEQAKAA